jgi:hypothetical protein
VTDRQDLTFGNFSTRAIAPGKGNLAQLKYLKENVYYLHLHLSHLADALIQSDLQILTPSLLLPIINILHWLS